MNWSFELEKTTPFWIIALLESDLLAIARTKDSVADTDTLCFFGLSNAIVICKATCQFHQNTHDPEFFSIGIVSDIGFGLINIYIRIGTENKFFLNIGTGNKF